MRKRRILLAGLLVAALCAGLMATALADDPLRLVRIEPNIDNSGNTPKATVPDDLAAAVWNEKGGPWKPGQGTAGIFAIVRGKKVVKLLSVDDLTVSEGLTLMEGFDSRTGITVSGVTRDRITYLRVNDDIAKNEQTVTTVYTGVTIRWKAWVSINGEAPPEGYETPEPDPEPDPDPAPDPEKPDPEPEPDPDPEQDTDPDAPPPEVPRFDDPTIPPTGTAESYEESVLIDGKTVTFKFYRIMHEDGTGTNYVRVRDLAAKLIGTDAAFDVTYFNKLVWLSEGDYVGKTDEAPFSGEKKYKLLSDPTVVNGLEMKLEAIQLTHNGAGYTYYKLRDLGKALEFNVGFANGSVYIETDKPYDPTN